MKFQLGKISLRDQLCNMVTEVNHTLYNFKYIFDNH